MLERIKERIGFAELSDAAYAASCDETVWLVREVERLALEKELLEAAKARARHLLRRLLRFDSVQRPRDLNYEDVAALRQECLRELGI